jgi:glyoxylase-like metal-dependent hydrolase (beta-lactamase superfamily II)
MKPVRNTVSFQTIGTSILRASFAVHRVASRQSGLLNETTRVSSFGSRRRQKSKLMPRDFASRPKGNLLIDSPRYAAEPVKWFDGAGGIAHILLSHSDDVADADKYARRFGASVWIHREDASAAPYATDLPDDGSAMNIAINVRAIPVPGHTRGSVVYLLDDRVMFSGDSLAWSPPKKDLVAFRDAC